jgi:hypothetical protein
MLGNLKVSVGTLLAVATCFFLGLQAFHFLNFWLPSLFFLTDRYSVFSDRYLLFFSFFLLATGRLLSYGPSQAARAARTATEATASPRLRHQQQTVAPYVSARQVAKAAAQQRPGREKSAAASAKERARAQRKPRR